MFKMFQEIRAQLRHKCPELSYIYWDLNQFDDADSGILPPALLLNISINWEGVDGEAVVDTKLWVMDYNLGAWEEETLHPYQLAEKILAQLEGMNGSYFNALQIIEQNHLPEYKGLVLSAAFRCNIRRKFPPMATNNVVNSAL